MSETRYIEKNDAGEIVGIYANPQFAKDGKTLRTERGGYAVADPIIVDAKAEWDRRSSEALQAAIQTGRSK